MKLTKIKLNIIPLLALLFLVCGIDIISVLAFYLAAESITFYFENN